jgi:hypothetical protein
MACVQKLFRETYDPFITWLQFFGAGAAAFLSASLPPSLGFEAYVG